MKPSFTASVGLLLALVGCGSDAPKETQTGSQDAASPVADDSSTTDAADAATATPGAADAAGDDGDAGPACPGIPIVPDDMGFVALGSNSLGIHGSWFVYSDCADLNGLNCATVTSPMAGAFTNDGGVMCTSGTTSTATGAWGAGIALELNDGPPQEPFDTVMAGIKGFCLQLSGPTIPSTTVRVAFPTVDNNDNAYFEPLQTPGQHTVLFTDILQGSWVTTPQPFEPTKVTLIQFQIPSSPSSPIPWNFCVSGLTAVMQ